MHSHIVEFLSVVFACFNVTFYLEYHRVAVSEVSKGKKWSVNPFQTLKVQEIEYTYSSTNFRNYEKKIVKVIKEQNLHKFVLRWCSEMNIGETWSFPLPGTWSKASYTKKNHIVTNIFGKEVDLHWQEVCATNSVFIIKKGQQIYSRAFVWVIVQHFISKRSNFNRNLHKVVSKKDNKAPR